MEMERYNYTMKVFEGSLEVSFKVIFCQIKKIRFLLF